MKRMAILTISVARIVYHEILLGFPGSILHRGCHDGYASAHVAPRR